MSESIVHYDLETEKVTVLQAYRFALDPRPDQEHELASHCGAQRFAYNWGLAHIKANLNQRDAERTYGLSGQELTPPVSWSAYSLRKEWNRAKDDVAPWWPENSKEAYASGLANLSAALTNWQRSRTGQRAGRYVAFPTFKTKSTRLSCRFTTGSFGLVADDRRHVRLPRIGGVRTHESTRKLARHIARGTARIRSATVTFRAGRWFVSFSVEVERAPRTPTQPNSVIGVDVGIRSLAFLSTGESIPNPKHLDADLGKLRRLQRRAERRRGPDPRREAAPSRRWHKTRTQIARVHARVANARRDGLHKLTSGMASHHGTIVIEQLNVSGMLKNRTLARAIADASWAELRRQLEYKTHRNGGSLQVADRWYPSSKTCSACGEVKAKLRLQDRIFACDHCGFTLDRDLNAARNLAELATSTASCAGTENMPAGNPGKPRLARAAGTATGRPSHARAGQPCRSNPAGRGGRPAAS
ncbi:IS607 family element RNA-guided endonuclease TnpB [Nocardia sp. NPDC058058]|uniref:IS607 family element RNA-guided endonuclease TnpB n=1 Tax=Nocardia sp. NPDC058058 TaxID=3346317 RepID=UPI0036DAB5D7